MCRDLLMRSITSYVRAFQDHRTLPRQESTQNTNNFWRGWGGGWVVKHFLILARQYLCSTQTAHLLLPTQAGVYAAHKPVLGKVTKLLIHRGLARSLCYTQFSFEGGQNNYRSYPGWSLRSLQTSSVRGSLSRSEFTQHTSQLGRGGGGVT
jgi:hypothetical protein